MALKLFGLFYIAALILLANAATVRGKTHQYLRLLQLALPAIIAIQLLGRVFTGDAQGLHQFLYFGIAATAIAIMLLLIGFESPWRFVERIVNATGLGVSPKFDNRQPVHRLALLLVVFALAMLYCQFSAAGSLQELLDSYATTEGALINLCADTTVYVLLAFLGVGWLVRRDRTDMFARLGLRLPSRMDLLAGISLGCVLVLGVSMLTLVWQHLVSASAFEWQTAAARQIFDFYSSSLFVGAFVALMAAIGEETLFRGALQPIFGVVLVSLFFTAIHMQYAFTPAAAIVFVISLAFGFLRAWLSTTAAITAHFVYNMIPFLLASLA